MKKNVSGQKIGAQLVTASNGSAFTGSVTVAVTGDAGTQATGSVGSGACAHEGNGYHTYAPAQAETNYDLVAFTFTGTGAVPATVQVFTSFPQTGDSFARLGAPAGASTAADIAAVKAETASILTDTAEIGAAGAGLTEAGGTGDHLTAIALSAAGVDAIWDEATSGHTTAGTTGKALTDAGGAGDPWSTALPGAYGAGTAGKIVGDNLTAPTGDAATPADVNAQVLDVINTDTFGLIGQESPGATVTPLYMLRWLYKKARNRILNDALEVKVYADDETTVDQKATVSKTSTEVSRSTFLTGAE